MTAAEQYPFVVKVAHAEYVQAPMVRASWREKRQIKRKSTIGGIQFNEVERVGWDRSGLTVYACGVGQVGVDRTPILRASGRRHDSGRVGGSASSTAAGVKSMVRRLRPQEAEAIAAVDAEITAHEKAIADLRAERKQFVALAWTNGHVVRLSEVQPDGDAARELVR